MSHLLQRQQNKNQIFIAIHSSITITFQENVSIPRMYFMAVQPPLDFLDPEDGS